MNLKQDRNNFKNNLYNILKDFKRLQKSKNTLQRCISHKLENTFNQYQTKINNLCKYLLSRDNYKVLKELSKREVINESKHIK